MKTAASLRSAPLMMVPFREVRHFQPEDALHFESINVRGQQYEWTIPAHQHDGLHQFQLLTHGSAVATLDGEPMTLQAPMALMVAPGVVHGFVYERDTVGQQVTVPTASLQAWLGPASTLEMQLHTSIGVRLHDKGTAECEALFGQLAREYAGMAPGRAEALNAYALVLALWFLRHAGQANAVRRSQPLRDTLVQRYRLLLQQHFRQQRSVQFYADALGVTADHLSRMCRLNAGVGALGLMHERVVLEARRLLAYTPGSVAEVAGQLGFEDPGHFSRFFTKAVGQAPSSYRSAVADGLTRSPN
jgi:AraC family transcriptional regulator, transcriptional activator of pobA